MQQRVDIATGILEFEITRADMPLTALLDFASRINLKRGYLFVSKVLGKHIPCRPSLMYGVQEKLAAHLPADQQTLFIGMAETAVGLGAGVAQAYEHNHPGKSAYLQTTRYPIAAPLLARFSEPHSHAVEHLIYEPLPSLVEHVYEADHIVLVDDEISTGNTLMNLARSLIQRLPQTRHLTFATLVNWLSPDQRIEYQQTLNKVGVELAFASLLDGTFRFELFKQQPASKPSLAHTTSSPRYPVRTDTGRRCLIPPKQITEDNFSIDTQLVKDRPLQVIGTGEFMHFPQWLALSLEQDGYNVLYQSTTRSPIHVGGAIKSKVEFEDEHGQRIPNFLYNESPFSGPVQKLVCYEQQNHAHGHNLFASERSTAFYL
jgi:hypothetical protein